MSEPIVTTEITETTTTTTTTLNNNKKNNTNGTTGGKKRKLNEIDDVKETSSKSKKMKIVNGKNNGEYEDFSNNGHTTTTTTNDTTVTTETEGPPEASWSNLKVSNETRKAIDALGFERMTEIQYKAIPVILEGNDLAGAAKTGSGKTLSFIIPAVELLAKLNWDERSMGTGVIIIAPTRELAIQIKEVADKIVRFHRNIKAQLIIGGASTHLESIKLRAGCAILVATPGRLMDHMENDRFKFDQLKMLVIDEADHILDIGFERQMRSILEYLPAERQTLLFSATLSDKTKELVTMAFRKRPAFVKAKGDEAGPTADKLEQMYAIIPQDKKFTTLLSWLRQHKGEKIVVFFSTRYATKFYEGVLNDIGIPVLALYGAMAQSVRTRTFFDFVKAKSGILLATNVASRGLDFPAVHWIIQFDPPEDPKEYIHRVGRTARAGLNGDALIFLQESELGYLNVLLQCNLIPKKVELEETDHDALQQKVEELVSSKYYLRNDAAKAMKSFIRSYNQRAPIIYSSGPADTQLVAKSFGLAEAPYQASSWGNEGRGGGGRRNGGGRGGNRRFGGRSDNWGDRDNSDWKKRDNWGGDNNEGSWGGRGGGRGRGRGGGRGRGRGGYGEDKW